MHGKQKSGNTHVRKQIKTWDPTRKFQSGREIEKWVVTINVWNKKNSKLGIRRAWNIGLEASNFCNTPSSTAGAEGWWILTALRAWHFFFAIQQSEWESDRDGEPYGMVYANEPCAYLKRLPNLYHPLKGCSWKFRLYYLLFKIMYKSLPFDRYDSKRFTLFLRKLVPCVR